MNDWVCDMWMTFWFQWYMARGNWRFMKRCIFELFQKNTHDPLSSWFTWMIEFVICKWPIEIGGTQHGAISARLTGACVSHLKRHLWLIEFVIHMNGGMWMAIEIGGSRHVAISAWLRSAFLSHVQTIPMTHWFVVLMKDRVCDVLMTGWVRDIFGWLIDFGSKRHGVISARLRGACWSNPKKIHSPLSSWFRWMIEFVICSWIIGFVLEMFKKISTPHWVCYIQMTDWIGDIWVLELCGSFQEMYACLRFTTY